MTDGDVKQIVHAHWIEGQTNHPNIHNILCSCCLTGYPSKGHANSQYTKERFQWCPSCGARMDEEVEKQKAQNERVNCENTKCDHCVNHHYCDYER